VNHDLNVCKWSGVTDLVLLNCADRLEGAQSIAIGGGLPACFSGLVGDSCMQADVANRCAYLPIRLSPGREVLPGAKGAPSLQADVSTPLDMTEPPTVSINHKNELPGIGCAK